MTAARPPGTTPAGRSPPAGGQWYADESKRGGFYLPAAVVAPAALAETRAMMRGLLLRNQHRLHFTKERPSRRSQILSAILRSQH